MTIFMAAFIMGGCSRQVTEKQAVTDEVVPVPVKVMEVTTTRFRTDLDIVSDIRSYRDVTLSALSGGTVEFAGPAIGDRVERGQIIARIGERLAAAQAESAEAALRLARLEFERQRELSEKGATTAQVAENARFQYETARAQYEMSLIQLENTRIKSPMDGFIAAKHIEVGEVVPPAAPVYEVVVLDQLKLTIGVAQEDLPKIDRSAPVRVQVSALGQTFNGRIESVGVRATANGQFPVEIVLDNPSRRIKPGMIGKVAVPVFRDNNAIALRQDYVLEKDGRKVVMIARDNRADEVDVQTGEIQNQYVRILSGVQPGDFLIIEGHGQLTEGQRIVIVD